MWFFGTRSLDSKNNEPEVRDSSRRHIKQTLNFNELAQARAKNVEYARPSYLGEKNEVLYSCKRIFLYR